MLSVNIHSTGLEGDRAYCINDIGSGKELEYVCEEVALDIWRKAAGEEREVMSPFYGTDERRSWWMKAMIAEITSGVVDETHIHLLENEGIDHC